MKHHIFIVLFALLSFFGCSSISNGLWIETENNGTKVWLADADTTLIYRWEGESFDSVAHGNGVLYIIANGDIVEKKTSKAYYGVLDNENIVSVGSNENYVGELNEDKFHGYGVYDKGKEIYIGHFKDSKPHGFATWYKAGKPYYSGMWEDGTFHGDGTLYKEDGTIKSGEWEHGNLTQTLVDVQLKEGHYNGYVKNNRPDGIGKMQYANGTVYSGKWKDGNYNGEGVWIQGTDTIVGNWEKGKICGDVIYRTDKFFYEGTMVDNFPTGIGNLTVEDNSFYTGGWVDGKRAGIGEIYFANGDSYVGEWDDNQFNGTGKYIYSAQKAFYEGDWVNGLQDGNGYYQSPEFSYRGEWEKGWMDGEGTLVFKNGDKYEGTVHENLIDGIGTYIYKNGNFYEGEFVEGQISGLGIFHFKNGTTFEGEFLNGKIYGDGTLNLVENGKVISITGFWTPDKKFPESASILFPTGDLYEGPIVNGFPTDAGTWTSAEERIKNIDKVENSTLHKANEFYKRNRETINNVLLATSAVVTTIEVVSKCIPHPYAQAAAGAAHTANVAINVVDAGMAIGSAAIDVHEAETLGEDSSVQWENLGAEIALNAAFVAVPKVAKAALKPLGKPLKNVTRSIAASAALGMKSTGKFIAKKSAIKFVKGKIYGKAIKPSVVKVKGGGRKIEGTLYRNKYTNKPKTAAERMLTRLKDQAVSYGTYLDKIRKNPELKSKLIFSAEGSSDNLANNMNLLGTDKWVKKNERIRRYLRLPKRQIEAHHVIPSKPRTPLAKEARKIWTKYMDSVDHPCNGIWLGKGDKQRGYWGLAKGANHGSNTYKGANNYEDEIGRRVVNAYKKLKKKYPNDPDMIRKGLCEVVDEIKKDLYHGKLSIGKDKNNVHTIWSVFKQPNGAVSQASKELLQLSL